MKHDPRPHIHRRGIADRRLRSLTTGTAVVGIAGTAAFGLVAAASWSGDPAATPLPATTTTGAGTYRAAPTAPTGVQPVAPNNGFAQPPTVSALRPNRGAGHATSGGSH
jgi:hypothetical protein